MTPRRVNRTGALPAWHHLHWRCLLRAIRLDDVHITSKLDNVKESRAEGFPRVHHMELAANSAMPDPGPLSEQERRTLGAPSGFSGHIEAAGDLIDLGLIEAACDQLQDALDRTDGG